MQVAERALRGVGGARPLDRAGILAPCAFDATVRYSASWCLCGGDGLFHCIHRSGDIDRRQSAANRAGADKHRAARPSHAWSALAPQRARRGHLTRIAHHHAPSIIFHNSMPSGPRPREGCCSGMIGTRPTLSGVPPLRRSLDPRAIAIFIVDNAHGKFLYGINTAISDNRDEWDSLFQEIICRLEGVLSGSRCNLYDPLWLAGLTLNNEHGFAP